MASRIFALLIWSAVAASLAFWGLRWLSRPIPVPSNASTVSLDNAGQGDLRRILNGPPKSADDTPAMSAAAQLAARIKLLGVVAPRAGQHIGVALVSVDGKPPRAVRLGGTVDGDMVLQSLTQRGADIGPADGPKAVTLALPLLPPAATGTLPPPTGIEQSTPPRLSIDGPPIPAQPGLPRPANGARGRLGGQPDDNAQPNVQGPGGMGNAPANRL